MNAGTDEYQPHEQATPLLPSAQIVLPLMQGVLMGLLVTGREDRHWNESRVGMRLNVAQTLASPGYWISVESGSSSN